MTPQSTISLFSDIVRRPGRAADIIAKFMQLSCTTNVQGQRIFLIFFFNI